MGKGNSPPARKLASLPFTAIRLGSANICNRFFCCKALMTAPRLISVRVTKKLRKSETLTVGAVGVVVVVVLPPLVVVVGAERLIVTEPNCPVWLVAMVFPRPG